MKKILFILLALTMVISTSCSEVTVNDDFPVNNGVFEETNDSSTESEYDFATNDVTYSTGLPTYRPLEDAQELVELADVVITGTVTNISFEVLEAETGLPYSEEIINGHYWLYTIYDIDVIETYKGQTNSSISIRAIGGIKDYRAKEQFNLLKEANAHEMGITIWSGNPKMGVGETYLFTLQQSKRDENLFSSLIPAQSVYNLDNPFEKQFLDGEERDNPEEYYSLSEDKNGFSIISIKDIIMEFGEDEWDEFWEDWQEDNPDWEDRIDREAAEKAIKKGRQNNQGQNDNSQGSQGNQNNNQQ